MSYQSANIRALPPPLRGGGGGVLVSFLLSLAIVIACMANAAADTPVTKTPSGPIFDFKPHPPGTYTLYKIKAASDGRVLDTAGKPRALSNFFGHGKVTLQSFIYSSCADPNGCPYAYTVFHYLKNKLQSEHPDVADKVRQIGRASCRERV